MLKIRLLVFGVLEHVSLAVFILFEKFRTVVVAVVDVVVVAVADVVVVVRIFFDFVEFIVFLCGTTTLDAYDEVVDGFLSVFVSRVLIIVRIGRGVIVVLFVLFLFQLFEFVQPFV